MSNSHETVDAIFYFVSRILPWVTTIGIPVIQHWFSRWAGALEMPNKYDTREYRVKWRRYNSLAGNSSRVEAFDKIMDGWLATGWEPTTAIKSSDKKDG